MKQNFYFNFHQPSYQISSKYFPNLVKLKKKWQENFFNFVKYFRNFVKFFFNIVKLKKIKKKTFYLIHQIVKKIVFKSCTQFWLFPDSSSSTAQALIWQAWLSKAKVTSMWENCRLYSPPDRVILHKPKLSNFYSPDMK